VDIYGRTYVLAFVSRLITSDFMTVKMRVMPQAGIASSATSGESYDEYACEQWNISNSYTSLTGS
jgi:hypothetical protein